MKTCIVLSVVTSFLLSVMLSFSQTIVDKQIDADATWTTSGSPYILKFTITIVTGKTLTIDPGVVVKMDGTGSMFNVSGAIKAGGTAEKPIVFTHSTDDEYGGDSNGDGNSTVPAPGKWQQIYLSEFSGNSSYFRNCLFRFGGRNGGTILANKCAPEVSGCIFEKCEYGWEASGLTRPILNNTHFKDITELAVMISPGCEPVFERNTFQNIKYTGIGLSTTQSPYKAGNKINLKKISTEGIENNTYIVNYTLQIPKDVILSIEPGITIKSKTNNDLFQVDGTLIAHGSSDQPIVFTSVKDDRYGGDSNNDQDSTKPGAADWGKIYIKEQSAATSSLSNCIFRFGGRTYGALTAENCSPKVSESKFEFCGYAWQASGNYSPELSDCQFENISELPILISPGNNAVFSGISFRRNKVTGIGLSTTLSSFKTGDQLILKKRNFAGINNIAYVADYVLNIPYNTQLTIEPGVVIKSINRRDIFQVDGTLIAEGTSKEPIVFTSIKDDNFGGDSNLDGSSTLPQYGDWRSVRIKELSGNTSKIKNCIFRYGGDVNGALYTLASSPGISFISVENCKKGIELSGSANVSISKANLLYCETGLLSKITGKVVIDSSLFKMNSTGISINSGNLTVHQSEFNGNRVYNVENKSPENIDATKNKWDLNTFREFLGSNIETNVKTIYDHFDNASMGYVFFDDFIKENGVWDISPDRATKYQDTLTVKIIASPIKEDTKVVLFNPVNGMWLAENTAFIDSLQLKAHLKFQDVKTGVYDLWLINGNDTLKKSAAFILSDSKTPFGEWVYFESNTDRKIISTTLLPKANHIYCLVKKNTHIGYSSTWGGSIAVSKDGEVLVNEDNTDSDVSLKLTNTEEGVYSYEIKALHGGYFDGYIKFCYEPDELILNNWQTGEILRPYGNDWKVFELTSDYEELHLKTQGYGKWSTLDVYYGNLDSPAKKWHFDNYGMGFNIAGFIQNAPKGKYYLKYMDSAVLYGNNATGSGQPMQYRTYMIKASPTGIKDDPIQSISGITLKAHRFGRGPASLRITGKGLSENTEVYLVQGNDTVKPVSQVYYTDTRTLVSDFDFSNVSYGSYKLVLKNEISVFEYQDEVFIEQELIKPLDIKITGNTKYRIGRRQAFEVKVTNKSNINIRNGFVKVEIFNDYVWLNTDDPFYSDESKKIINDAYESLKVNREFFYFSNLPPGSSVTLELKMICENPYVDAFDLEVTGGSMDDETYNELYSNYINVVLDNLLTYPIGSENKRIFNAMQNGQRQFVFDLIMESLGANTFNFIPNFKYEKSLLLEMQGSQRAKTEAKIKTNNTASQALRELIQWTDNAGNAIEAFGDKLLLLTEDDLAEAIIEDVEGEIVDFCEDIIGNSLTNLTSPINVGLEDAFSGPDDLFNKLLEWTKGMFNDASLALADLYDNLFPDEEEKEDEKNKKTLNKKKVRFQTVGSVTPEDKFGPIGASVQISESFQNHYIDTSAVFDYRIDYWNKADATAPAAIVYISDTLDTDFDLSTFNFTEIGFLKWTAKLDGGHYFNVNIDCRPDMPYIVNVEGTIDLETREAYWVHTTLDPETMKLTDDPMGGYLPPVDSAWYNLGWVKYNIKPLPGLPDSTVFTNQAFVNFDGVGPWGPAPKEGPFTNIFDASNPTSFVLAGLDQTAADSIMIFWSGKDSGSGIQSYDIYVSDGGNYYLWQTAITDTTAWFKGENGKTYHFYSIAHDLVGNTEAGGKNAEYTISFGSTGSGLMADKSNQFELYPNPTSGLFTVKVDFPDGESPKIEIFTVSGLKIYSSHLANSINVIDIKNIPAGMYLIQIKHKTGSGCRKLIVNK